MAQHEAKAIPNIIAFDEKSKTREIWSGVKKQSIRSGKYVKKTIEALIRGTSIVALEMCERLISHESTKTY